MFAFDFQIPMTLMNFGKGGDRYLRHICRLEIPGGYCTQRVDQADRWVKATGRG